METINVKIARLDPSARVPSYAHATDACFDLYAVYRRFDEDGNVVYGTGLAFEIPEGHYLQLQPRSSATRYDLVMINAPGVVDSGYRGEVTFKYRPLRKDGRVFAVGERVGQGVVLPCPRVAFSVAGASELSPTDRGSGGYGSTGKY